MALELRKRDREPEARPLLIRASASLSAPPPDVEDWWNERNYEARNALDGGDMQQAYLLASGHNLTKDAGVPYAEAEFLANHSHTARVFVDFVKSIDHEIKRATNNNLDLKIVFAVGIICLTVFEVGATAATPVWVTLAIFTVNHFIQMHEQQHLKAAQAGPKMAPINFKGQTPVQAIG